MSACVAQHRADRSGVDARRNRYFACLHFSFREHSPEALFGARQRVGSPFESFREFVFLESLAFSKSRVRGFLTDQERCMRASLPVSPHIDALVLGNPDCQPFGIRRRRQRLPDLPETYHRLLCHIFGILVRREEILADVLGLSSQDRCQKCKLYVLHTP